MPKLSRAKLEARRQHILRAAAACFDRQGFHRTTIADVRREAGVSTGAIYTYFPNKEAIIRALLQDAQHLRRAQLEAAAARSGTSQSERAVLLQWAERAFTEQGTQIARVNVNLWAEALRDTVVGELARRALENATQTVAEVVGREMSRMPRALAIATPHDVASVLVAIHLGLEVQNAVGVKLHSAGIVRVLDELFAAPAKPKRARPSGARSGPGAERKPVKRARATHNR